VSTLLQIMDEIRRERNRQDLKWGEQNHPDGTGPEASDSSLEAHRARNACRYAAKRGAVTWRHILREEFAEAMAEGDPMALRAELVQVAAVAVAWVEAIDRRPR